MKIFSHIHTFFCRVGRLSAIMFVFLVFAVFISPTQTMYAAGFDFAGSIVDCGKDVTSYVNDAGQVCTKGLCTTCDLLKSAKKVIDFIVVVGMVLAVVLFVNAGFLYVTGGSSPASVAKAHRIFLSTLFGLIITLSAWLLIDLIMKSIYGGEGWAPWNEILCPRDLGSEVCVAVRETLPADPKQERYLAVEEFSIKNTKYNECYDKYYLGCSVHENPTNCLEESCGTQPQCGAPCAPVPSSGGAGMVSEYDTQKVTSDTAKQLLKESGVAVVGASAGPPVQIGVVDGLVQLNQQCGDCVVVTSLSGGTHVQSSGHYQGIKADIDDTPATVQHIQTNWKRGVDRTGEYGGATYISPSGTTVCVQEKTHFDCCFNRTDNKCS